MTIGYLLQVSSRERGCEDCHTQYGTPSGPVAGEGEDLLRKGWISLFVRGSSQGSRVRGPRGGRGAFGRKQCSRRALSMETGSEADAREGNLEFFRGATPCFAVQMF